MRQVHATLTRPVPRKIAYMAGRIAREATIANGDIEDAGKTSQAAKDDARSETQSWTSERRIDEISLSAQTGATWFFHARSRAI